MVHGYVDSISNERKAVRRPTGFDLDKDNSGEYENFNKGLISTDKNMEEENIETTTDVVGNNLDNFVQLQQRTGPCVIPSIGKASIISVSNNVTVTEQTYSNNIDDTTTITIPRVDNNNNEHITTASAELSATAEQIIIEVLSPTKNVNFIEQSQSKKQKQQQHENHLSPECSGYNKLKPVFVRNNDNNNGWSNTQVPLSYNDQIRLQRSDDSANYVHDTTTTKSEGQYNGDDSTTAENNTEKSDVFLDLTEPNNTDARPPIPQQPKYEVQQLQYYEPFDESSKKDVVNDDRKVVITQASCLIPYYKDHLNRYPTEADPLNYSRASNGSSRGNSTNVLICETKQQQLTPNISSTYLMDTNSIECNNNNNNIKSNTRSRASNKNFNNPGKGKSTNAHTVEAVPVKSVVLVTAQLYNYNEDTDDNNINNNLKESVRDRNGGVKVENICNNNLPTTMKPVPRNESKRRKYYFFFCLLLVFIVTLLLIGVGIYVRNDGCRNDKCSTKTTNINSTETQIMEPSNVPTISPTISHIPTIYRKPFQDGTELLNVVDKYLYNTDDINEIITTYGPIEEWDVSNVTDFPLLFSTVRTNKATDFNADLSKWDMRSATNINNMFDGAKIFNADLSKWDVSNVQLISSLFQGATNFQSDLSRWNVTSALYTSSMFADTDYFDSDLSNWDVRNVLWMDQMFANAVSFRSDLSRWNVSKVSTMSFMFSGANKFESDLSKWDTSCVTSLNHFADKATKFNSDVSKWNTSQVDDFNFAFQLAESFQGIGMDRWDVRKGVFFDNMFTGARKFDANLSKWNTTNAITMIEMFAATNEFRGIGMEHWTLAKVTNTSGMFNGAIQFDCNVSSWDVSNIADMTEMFAQATKFQGIGLDSWQLDDTTETLNIFCDSTAINKTNIADWNVAGSNLFC